jgi:hypothetical protein
MKKILSFSLHPKNSPLPPIEKLTFDSFYTQGAKKILYSRLKSMSISALEEFGRSRTRPLSLECRWTSYGHGSAQLMTGYGEYDAAEFNF